MIRNQFLGKEHTDYSDNNNDIIIYRERNQYNLCLKMIRNKVCTVSTKLFSTLFLYQENTLNIIKHNIHFIE